MPLLGSPTLTFDEIDDLLYFTRVNEADDLNQTIKELAEKYTCAENDVLVSAVDSDSGNTMLHYCSANGLSDLLNSLVSRIGIQAATDKSKHGKQPDRTLINAANKEGNTPLHWAAYNGHLDVVKILVACGADIWVKNAAGHLAMFEAERAEKSDVVQFLLEAGGESVDRAAARSSTEVDVESTENGEGEASSEGATADVAMNEN